MTCAFPQAIPVVSKQDKHKWYLREVQNSSRRSEGMRSAVRVGRRVGGKLTGKVSLHVKGLERESGMVGESVICECGKRGTEGNKMLKERGGGSKGDAQSGRVAGKVRKLGGVY